MRAAVMGRGHHHLAAVGIAEGYVFQTAPVAPAGGIEACAGGARVDALRPQVNELAELGQRPVVRGEAEAVGGRVDDHRSDAVLSLPGRRDSLAAVSHLRAEVLIQGGVPELDSLRPVAQGADRLLGWVEVAQPA